MIICSANLRHRTRNYTNFLAVSPPLRCSSKHTKLDSNGTVSSPVQYAYNVQLNSWRHSVCRTSYESQSSIKRRQPSETLLAMIAVLLLLVIVLFVACGEMKKWRIQRGLVGFAVPKQLPILGVAGRFVNKTNEQMIDMLNEIVAEVDKTPIQAWFGPFLGVVIAEPDDMQAIFNSDDCLNRPYFYDHLRLGTAIFVATRELWKPQRRAFEPLFNFKMVQEYVPRLNEKSRILAGQVDAHVSVPNDLYRTLFMANVDMILQTTTGADYHIQTTEMGPFLYKTIKQIMSHMMYRITRIWLKWNFTYSLTQVYRDDNPLWASAQRFLEHVIAEKTADLENSRRMGIDHLAMAQSNGTINLLEKCLLLERNNVYTRTETIDQMHAIIIGGVVSSTITMHTTLLMLAIHSAAQDAVLAELCAMCASDDCDLSAENVKNLTLLDRCVREAMRLFPPTPLIARHTANDIRLASGTIPKDTIVVLDIFHLHRNAKIWGEHAMAFDPDRFLAERSAERPAYSYVPFAAGPRNCMCTRYAMTSMKITLAHLLRRYKFTSSLRMDEIRFKMSLAMDIVNENPLTIERRPF